MAEQRKEPCSSSTLPKTGTFSAWPRRARPLADAVLVFGEYGPFETNQPCQTQNNPTQPCGSCAGLRGTPEPRALLAGTRIAFGYTRQSPTASATTTAEPLQ